MHTLSSKQLTRATRKKTRTVTVIFRRLPEICDRKEEPNLQKAYVRVNIDLHDVVWSVILDARRAPKSHFSFYL